MEVFCQDFIYIRRDLASANFWARWDLWNCEENKSKKSRPDPRKV